MNHSSFGSAAPKDRGIDVGANLLGEWIEEQAQVRKASLRDGAILAASLLFALVAGPLLWKAVGESSSQAAVLRAGVARLDRELDVSGRARKAAQPALLVDEMRKGTRASFDRLMDRTNAVLRAGNPRTALSSVRCEVQGGEAHLVVQGFGEDDAAADAFARDAGDERTKVAAITSSRPSELLGTRGVGFEYVQRIEVGG